MKTFAVRFLNVDNKEEVCQFLEVTNWSERVRCSGKLVITIITWEQMRLSTKSVAGVGRGRN